MRKRESVYMLCTSSPLPLRPSLTLSLAVPPRSIFQRLEKYVNTDTKLAGKIDELMESSGNLLYQEGGGGDTDEGN